MTGVPHICPVCKTKAGHWSYGLLVRDEKPHFCTDCHTPLVPVLVGTVAQKHQITSDRLDKGAAPVIHSGAVRETT
jgi:hypothetical protein